MLLAQHIPMSAIFGIFLILGFRRRFCGIQWIWIFDVRTPEPALLPVIKLIDDFFFLKLDIMIYILREAPEKRKGKNGRKTKERLSSLK